MSAKLSLRSVAVQRDGREVLAIDALDVEPGEVLAVLGPNGAGKTTLLQVLGLLERPASGEVLYDGLAVAGRQLSLRRRMSLVFQEALLLNRSVQDNVALAVSLRGQADGRGRARRWLARFGVESLAKRPARTLSGGEAQRASLARAFAPEPEVLLLDEPFSSLDQPTRQSLIEDLAAVLSETRTTTVLVTHDRDEAARLADRVAVLSGGRLLQVGPITSVYSAPADDTVAAYVGVETVVPARVVGREQEVIRLAVADREIEAVAERFDAPHAFVCLRPEDVVLASASGGPADSARNHLRGVVRAIAPSGSGVRVSVDCGFPLVAAITRQSLEDLGLREGSPVGASFKATAVHLIPRAGS